MNTVEEKAKAMIKTFRDALGKGFRHFDLNGKELCTVKEILEALQRDGKVNIEEPK